MVKSTYRHALCGTMKNGAWFLYERKILSLQDSSHFLLVVVHFFHTMISFKSMLLLLVRNFLTTRCFTGKEYWFVEQKFWGKCTILDQKGFEGSEQNFWLQRVPLFKTNSESSGQRGRRTIEQNIEAGSYESKLRSMTTGLTISLFLAKWLLLLLLQAGQDPADEI